MHLREANANDLHSLVNIMEGLVNYVQDSTNDPYINDIERDKQKNFRPWFEKAFSNPDSTIFIAEVDDRIAGFISGTLSEPFVNTTTIGRIGQIGVCWVEPEFRKRGYSRALVNTIESWFEGRGVEFIEIHYLEGNLEAKQAWAHLGFEPYRIASRKNCL